MPFIQWSDDYKCHIAAIDDDHRMLFHIVNSLHDDVQRKASMREIGSTISALIDYVEIHFTREERYLEQYGYPEINTHKKAHTALKNRVYAIQRIFIEDPKRLDTDKVLEFLKNWLTKHIQEEDFKYIPFLKGELKGIKGDPGAALEEVTVRVPAYKVPLIHACAEILTAGGKMGRTLEDTLTGFGEETGEADAVSAREEFLTSN